MQNQFCSLGTPSATFGNDTRTNGDLQLLAGPCSGVSYTIKYTLKEKKFGLAQHKQLERLLEMSEQEAVLPNRL
ncbi:MAG: hypothetical protein COB29_01285 [Sulfitobacter sp.]|nr:MAG: hypothetical protein COB29_01285 [Sulfitobacter sp.]